jgi:hypothetical protein
MSESKLSCEDAKRLLKRQHLYVLWNTCVAVSEMKTMRTKEKNVRVCEYYRLQVNGAKVTEVTALLQCEVPTATDWDEIKKILNLKTTGDGEQKCGAALWNTWTQLKHTFRSHYAGKFILSSGKNEDDAIEACMQTHWVEKRNKSIKSSNKDRESKGKDARPYVTLKECSPNLHHRMNLFPEAVLYLLVRESPLLQGGTKRSAKEDWPSTPGDAENDNYSGDEEDKLKGKMNINGTFTSRKKQRLTESRRNKREATSAKNVQSGKKEDAAMIHATAAKEMAESSIAQTKLQAIAQAGKLGVSNDVLRSLMEKTLGSLFGDTAILSPNSDNEASNENTEAANQLVMLSTQQQQRARQAAGGQQQQQDDDDESVTFLAELEAEKEQSVAD